MEGFVPILFLAVVLKIPVGLLLYLVWWAFHAQPESEEAPPPGAEDHEFRRWRQEPSPPRGPRRGPHAPDAQPIPPCPPGGRSRVARPSAPVRGGSRSAGRRGTADAA